MKTKITNYAKERIQKRLEEEVKDMTWEQRVSHLSKVASVYLAELSNYYDDIMMESQYTRYREYYDMDGKIHFLKTKKEKE